MYALVNRAVRYDGLPRHRTRPATSSGGEAVVVGRGEDAVGDEEVEVNVEIDQAAERWTKVMAPVCGAARWRARARRRCQAAVARTMRPLTQVVQAGWRASRRRSGLDRDRTR
jgi:hypothetical protein